jgi:hypothetical protein
MFMVLCLSWWYTAGWKWVWQTMLVNKIMGTAQAFSMPDMARTLFAPYRQTFAGKSRGSLGAIFRGMIDNLISRILGFLVRLVLLISGLVGCFMIAVMGVSLAIAWVFIPIMPIIGIILLAIGYTR